MGFFSNLILISSVKILSVDAARQVILDRAAYLRKNHQFPDNDFFNEKGKPILPIGTMMDDLPLPFSNLLKENNQPYASQQALEMLRKDENSPKFLQLENRYDVSSIFNNFLGDKGKNALDAASKLGQAHAIPPEISKIRFIIAVIVIVILIVACAIFIIPAIKNLLVACVYPKGGEPNESFLGRNSGGGDAREIDNRNPYLQNKDESPSGNSRSAFGEGHAGTKNYSQYGHDTGGNKYYEASNTQLQQDHNPTPLPLPNPKKNSRKNKKESNSKDRSEAKPHHQSVMDHESVMDPDPQSPVTHQSNVSL